MDTHAFLTVEETAEFLRIGRNTCYQLVREHRIPAVRLGRRLLIPRARLLRWLDEATASADPDVVPFLYRDAQR